MSAWNMALRSLGRRKVRTALTVSGIIVGVSMAFAFLSLVAGIDVQISDIIRRIGGADITMYNATRLTRQQILAGATNTLDESLLTTISEGVVGVYAVSPQLTFIGSVNGTRAPINGIDQLTHSIVTGGLNIINGSSLQEGSEKEVVLGKTLADTLEATIGGDVLLSPLQPGGESYKVVGVYETGMALQDRGCYITIDESQNMTDREGIITAILIKVIDPNEVSSVRTEITNLIPDIRLVVPTAAIQQVSNMLNTVRMFFFTISLVALLAGSFGVVNTMLTTVTERTREIGTLKAIGAKGGQILTIFITEALLLGVIGGGVGVLIGIGLSILFPMFAGGLSGLPLGGFLGRGGRTAGGASFGGASITPAILPSTILLCFSLGIIVGILAGLYPAWRASRMKPVEALRHV